MENKSPSETVRELKTKYEKSNLHTYNLLKVLQEICPHENKKTRCDYLGEIDYICKDCGKQSYYEDLS